MHHGKDIPKAYVNNILQQQCNLKEKYIKWKSSRHIYCWPRRKQLCLNLREIGQYRCLSGNKTHENLSQVASYIGLSKFRANRATEISKLHPYKISLTTTHSCKLRKQEAGTADGLKNQ
jgi:hypothetical protein